VPSRTWPGRFLGGDSRDKWVIVMAGTGGNGGGALVCARRLHGWGAQVKVLLTKPERGFAPVPAHQLRILSQMHVEVDVPEIPIGGPSPDLIIDGVIGYSLTYAPTGMAGELIRWANAVDPHPPFLEHEECLTLLLRGVENPTLIHVSVRDAAAELLYLLVRERLQDVHHGEET
jgi:hypothetical protein